MEWEWDDKGMKEKAGKQELFIQEISDKEKLRKFVVIKPSLQEMLQSFRLKGKDAKLFKTIQINKELS